MRFSTGRFIFSPRVRAKWLPDYTLSLFLQTVHGNGYNCFDLFSSDPVSIDGTASFRIKICIFAFLLLYLKRYMDWQFLLINKTAFPWENSVFFLMQSVQYSLLWSSNGLPHFFLQDGSPIQITFFRQSSQVSFPTYITSSQTGHLGEIQCWITPLLFSKILSKNLSGFPSLTPFLPCIL